MMEYMKKQVQKVKDIYVLVITADKNGKQRFMVCESMELAKKCFPGDTQKQFVTFVQEIK